MNPQVRMFGPRTRPRWAGTQPDDSQDLRGYCVVVGRFVPTSDAPGRLTADAR